MSNFIAIYDACVLYPAPLRDFLMHLALTDLFRAKWTKKIHEEWMTRLLENRPDLTKEKLERTRELMDKHSDECLIEGYESLIEAVTLPDPNDRHVLAAAIKGNAAVIVTFNLEDFPNSALRPYDLDAQDPDTFICHLLDLNPALVCTAAKRQRANLKNPPRTINEFLGKLEEQGLHRAVRILHSYAELL
jgi:predicted nucleic acid-binding protein